MKLNLACGTDVKPAPWVNLDVVRKWPQAPRPCDILWDARKDRIPFAEGSVDEVKAGYLFLHLAPQHHTRVLKDIYRVLQPGGRLEVGEVDMEKAMTRWMKDPSDKSATQMIWGEQGNDVDGNEAYEEFDKHCQGYTPLTLRAFLEGVGLKAVKQIKLHAAEVWYELSMEAFK